MPRSYFEKFVEFVLSRDDAKSLIKEISAVASKLERGFIAGRLWGAYDCIDECLHKNKGNF
jgi:hypothetical protein